MKLTLQLMVTALVAALFAVCATGCHTVEGAGEDIEAAGEGIEEGAEELAD